MTSLNKIAKYFTGYLALWVAAAVILAHSFPEALVPLNRESLEHVMGIIFVAVVLLTFAG